MLLAKKCLCVSNGISILMWMNMTITCTRVILASHKSAVCVIICYVWLHGLCACALPNCPRLVGDHFATVAVGDQMANWALCHVTSLHWGPSQSAQARLLNCRRPHRHHSPILTESSFRGPEGPFQRLTERALLQLIRHQATGLFTFSQPEWLNLCVTHRLTSLQFAD